MIVAPPFEDGAVKATVAVVDPVCVAVPIVGAPGTVAAIEPVELLVPVALPCPFVPVTTQDIAEPTSASTKAYVVLLDPTLVPPRFHWYANEIVAVPVQVPVELVRV